MKTITVTIEIKNIERWDIDWNNKDHTHRELRALEGEIKFEIYRSIGVSYGSIDVKAVLNP